MSEGYRRGRSGFGEEQDRWSDDDGRYGHARSDFDTDRFENQRSWESSQERRYSGGENRSGSGRGSQRQGQGADYGGGSYDRDSYRSPGSGRSGQSAPAYLQPGKTGYGQSAYGQASYGQGVYDEPGYGGGGHYGHGRPWGGSGGGSGSRGQGRGQDVSSQQGFQAGGNPPLERISDGEYDRGHFFGGGMQRGEHRGRGPRNYVRSDERIREDVNDRLSDDSWLDASDIDVAVSEGEVTLSGEVASREDRRRAEDIVEDLSGVKHVQNNLRVRQAGQAGPSTASTGASSGTQPNATTSGPATRTGSVQ